MTHNEMALEIVKKNEQKIRNILFERGYMYDEELDKYMSNLTARKIATSIQEFFGLEEEFVIREEMKPEERDKGVIYFSGANIEWEEVKRIAKKHYQIK